MKKSILPQVRHLYSVMFTALLVACGSSKDVGYADGIYNDSPQAKQEASSAEVTETSSDLNTQYYKNYFADTAQ